MINVLVVVIGGALGAVARYLLDGLIQEHVHGAIPVGTLVINVSGSLVLGVLVGLQLEHGLPATIGLAGGTGFCGAFTTFSSLMYDTIRLAQDGAQREATLTLLLNVVLGGIAAALGLLVTGAL
jgi:fluoride exporter